MDTKRLVAGTLVGGIVVYILGYLIFTLAFGSFYAANVGSATGVARDQGLIWAVVLAGFAYGALVTFTIGNRTGSLSLGEGAKIGAIVGFLLWFTADFVTFGLTNTTNLTITVVDPLLELVRGAIVGLIIAAVLSKMTASGGERASA